MKAVAILKDSIRESWDSKILLVLIILTMFISLFVVSIGYVPAPAEKIVQEARYDFRIAYFVKAKPPFNIPRATFNVGYEVTDFKTITPAANPANGVYEFTLKASPSAPTDMNAPGPKRKGLPLPNLPKANAFHKAVYIWNLQPDDVRSLDLMSPNQLTDTDLLKFDNVSVDAKMMEEFIAERFQFHLNLKIKSVQRVDGDLNGDQLFKVTTDQSDPRAWMHHTTLFFGAIDLKEYLPEASLGSITYNIQDNFFNSFGAGIAIILGIIVTSFFIPNMLRKGSIDLMLSKPVSRTGLLLSKYCGGLSFMFILTTVAMGSIWVAMGLRTGLWNMKTLLVIPLLTYSFAVLYACSTMVSVWTRSAIASLLVTMAFGCGLWIFKKTYEVTDNVKKVFGHEDSKSWVYPTVKYIDMVLPRTRDLDKMSTLCIADVYTPEEREKTGINKAEVSNLFGVFGISFAWIAGMLALACWRFSAKDY